MSLRSCVKRLNISLQVFVCGILKFSRDTLAVRCCTKYIYIYIYVVWNAVLFPPPPPTHTHGLCMESLRRKNCLHIVSRNPWGDNKITGSIVMGPFLLLNFNSDGTLPFA